MKILRPLFICVCIGVWAVAAKPLAAQQLAPGDPAKTATAPVPPAPAPPATGSSMVTLPAGWKVFTQTPDAPYAPNSGVMTPNTDPMATILLLAAGGVSPRGQLTLNLFVTHFRPYGPTLGAGGNDQGIETESTQFMHAVLMQGYAPSHVQIDRGTTNAKQPFISVVITAKNAGGDERIFSDTALATDPSGPHYRLYISRPAADPDATNDAAAIIQSLNTPDATPANGAAAPAAGGSVASAQPQPAAIVNNSVSALPADGTVTTQAAQIVQDYHSALVMVEGNKGVGSGFLCSIDGHTFVITNAHVLADNYGVKITSLDGTVFTTGSSAVAVEHDIVKLQTATPARKAFEIMTALDSTAKIGDAVMIPGNAEGAQVVRPVEGKIVGIGPNLVEVDAPFVKGNSGSPIIHEATGKVLGVATYLIQRKVDQDASTGKVVLETRRFGYRIDSVKQWQPINWQIFFAESQQVSAIEDLSDDFITMFNDMEHDSISADHYKSATMARAIRSFFQAKNELSMNASAQDRQAVLRGFFADLRAATQGDIATFTARPSYDYFRRDVDDQAHFREELYDTFTKAMQSVQN